MAQEGRLTPEKQLLKIIEDPKAKDGASGSQSRVMKRGGLSFLSLSAWKSRISFMGGKLKNRFSAGSSNTLNIKAVNRALAFCIICIAAYLGTNIYTSIEGLKNITAFKPKPKGALKPIELPEFSKLGALSYYLEKVRERNIFKMGAKPVTEETTKQTAPRGPSSVTMDAASHLNLVGISWSDDPDVIIEDTQAMRTYFVKRGQVFGKFKIQAIFKDKVILDFCGEEIELK